MPIKIKQEDCEEMYVWNYDEDNAVLKTVACILPNGACVIIKDSGKIWGVRNNCKPKPQQIPINHKEAIEIGDHVTFKERNGNVHSGWIVDFDLYTNDPVVDTSKKRIQRDWCIQTGRCPRKSDILSVNGISIEWADPEV